MNLRLILHSNKLLFQQCGGFRSCCTPMLTKALFSQPLKTPSTTLSKPLVSFLSTQSNEPPKPLTGREKFKKAVAEYGTTVVVFHITISLISLGTCYFLISNGVDLGKYMEFLHLSEGIKGKMTSSAGTFVAAYAVHKIFGPVRIAITLGSAPFIVRFLRAKGILKKPVK